MDGAHGLRQGGRPGVDLPGVEDGQSFRQGGGERGPDGYRLVPSHELQVQEFRGTGDPDRQGRPEGDPRFRVISLREVISRS